MSPPTDAKTGQPIFGYRGVGFSNVGSYQVSARPFLSSSIDAPASGANSARKAVEFPRVTRFVTVRNDGKPTLEPVDAQMKVAFAENGLGIDNNNFIVIDASASISFEFRVTRLYAMSMTSNIPSFTVAAGQTNITGSHLANVWDNNEGIDLGGNDGSGV